MGKQTTEMTLIVMAKPAVPGKVKTRLIGEVNADQAAQVHQAMLRCTLERLERHIASVAQVRKVLCYDLRIGGDPGDFQFDGWNILEQGQGNLGQRMSRIWRDVGSGRVAFFGADTPDVPAHALAAIAEARQMQICPVDDGGYWTLTAPSQLDAVLDGIDWGTASVYHQTRAAAEREGIDVVDLPTWHDVDEPDDLVALRKRIADTTEPELMRLRDELDRIFKEKPMQPESTPNPSTESSIRPAIDETDYSDCRILIIDDNHQNVELLQAYLEELPCEIMTAYDGIEGMKIVDGEPKPDVVLLDVMMPRMSGFEVCRKIKEDPSTRSIPVIMVTALNELGDIERGVESGTDDFLTKPVNKLELVTRVKTLLRLRCLNKELERTKAYIREFGSDDSGAGMDAVE